MKNASSTICGIIYLLCSIAALLAGLFFDIDCYPLLEFPLLFINLMLFGLTYYINRRDKLRCNLFSVETIIGYLGIMFMYLPELAYYEINEDSFRYDYYNAVSNIETGLLIATVVSIIVNILSLFDKKKKFEKVFVFYYTALLALTAAALIYLTVKSF